MRAWVAHGFDPLHTGSGWTQMRGMRVPDRSSLEDADRVAQRAGADRRRGALMAAAQDGDQAAYAALLRECLPLLRSLVRRQGVPTDSMEDAVQDVLLTLHRVRHTYDPSRSFTAWLSGIARHRALDQLRRARARARVESPGSEADEHYADPAEAADTALARSDAASRLRAAVQTLPASQREAVQHLALADLSLTEAASLTHKTKVALKVSLHRALKTLRLRLQDEGADD